MQMHCCSDGCSEAVICGATPRGSALQKRLRDREKEMEADERDRKREKEELEEIRQRLLDEGHPDPDAELRRVGFPNNTVCVFACKLAVSMHADCCLCEGHFIIRVSLHIWALQLSLSGDLLFSQTLIGC